MADARAQDALARLQAGEQLDRRESRRAYNGAQGVPIREEIVSRHGETIITRNGYGARCLNTPDVLFVDMDFADYAKLPPVENVIYPLLTMALIALSLKMGWYWVAGACALGLVVVAIRDGRRRLAAKSGPNAESAARSRVAEFVAANPDWRFRLYKTPAGLRALAMHRTFQPDEPAVAECFAALGADPVYARMCLNQRCFRARVSAKPWRIGVRDHIKPTSGAWPVPPEHQPARSRWIEEYERAARNHSSCHYLESVGGGAEHAGVRAVQSLHDELCRANMPLPTA